MVPLLTHRCWPIQAATGDLLSHHSVSDIGPLLTAACDPETDPWGRMVLWRALLSQLDDRKLRSRAADILIADEGAFDLFADAIFGFIEASAPAGELTVELRAVNPRVAAERSALAGGLWGEALLKLRTLARRWYGDLRDRNLESIVASFSAKRVCPFVRATELSGKPPSSIEGLTVTRVGGGLYCSVEKDDVAVELSVMLPPLYPLKGVEVELTKGNLPASLLRRWVLRMTILTMSSEGSLYSAVEQWGATASSFFDTVESCHICFCVLTEQGALPKIKCANCNCSFHSDCLAKWFATSHVAKCCMCQLPWKKK